MAATIMPWVPLTIISAMTGRSSSVSPDWRRIQDDRCVRLMGGPRVILPILQQYAITQIDARIASLLFL
ncbi:hypothetical protein BMW24_004805 [Mycobacterium heckeshornense]|uniref:Uncharacterized protein n=1 Tax=Mycobacterium heckeshornense TaxID=110505 RepID=A0A2G8BGV7_9MYCO|nr:hypothetical protein ACT16_20515 [Mycobacterium heckeshornense]PIJ37007.1 hypothetical protein BMW24_004805 [Mycobacterium heckeshornense]BCO35197.1 hypothetical protein MHEC_16300 [Mycobacterium heckeshornense]